MDEHHSNVAKDEITGPAASNNSPAGDHCEKTFFDRLTLRLKNVKFVAFLLLGVTLIAGTAGLISNIKTIRDSFWSSKVTLSGSLSLNTDLSPYMAVSKDDERYPKRFAARELTFYRPLDELEFLVPYIRGSSIFDKTEDLSSADDERVRLLKEAGALDPNALQAQGLFRLFLRGAVVLDYVRKNYRESSFRTPELDDVFEPDKPHTRKMEIEASRFKRYLGQIYVRPTASPAERAMAKRIVEVSSAVWPDKKEYADEAEEYQSAFEIFKYVILRKTEPVFRLNLTNTSEMPAVITRVSIEVKEFASVKDTNVSGPLQILDTVEFELSGQPEKLGAALTKGPLKIAPKDAAAIQVRLKSKRKGTYLASTFVWSDQNLLYQTPDFLVAFFVS